MGGHGGLNILPQKRWNVYNRDNRLKVARDEAKHEAAQKELQEKHRAAEAQSRRHLLLERAKQQRATALGAAGILENSFEEDQQLITADPSAGQPQLGHSVLEQQLQQESRAQCSQGNRHREHYGEQERNEHHWLQQRQEQQQAQQEPEPVLEHINFWKELETKAEHPDRQKEKRDERKRRGNPDTYTTDARFDEGFKLGHGLTGPKPWYARHVNPTAAGQHEQQFQALEQHKQQPQTREQLLQLTHAASGQPVQKGSKHRKRRRHRSSSDTRGSNSGSSSSSSGNSTSPESDVSNSDSSVERPRSKSRHKRKRRSSSSRKGDERKKHKKHKKHRSEKYGNSPVAGLAATSDKALALARLRAERLEREAAERNRSLEATGQRVPANKRYHSSYGYADALKHGPGAGAMATAQGAANAAAHGLGSRFGR